MNTGKFRPKDRYLQSLKEESYLGEDREFYQSRLENRFESYDFSPIDDTTLMNIYEMLEHEQHQVISEYFDDGFEVLPQAIDPTESPSDSGSRIGGSHE